MSTNELRLTLRVDVESAATFVDKIASAFERFGREEPSASATPAFGVLTSSVEEAMTSALASKVDVSGEARARAEIERVLDEFAQATGKRIESIEIVYTNVTTISSPEPHFLRDVVIEVSK